MHLKSSLLPLVLASRLTMAAPKAAASTTSLSSNDGPISIKKHPTPVYMTWESLDYTWLPTSVLSIAIKPISSSSTSSHLSSIGPPVTLAWSTVVLSSPTPSIISGISPNWAVSKLVASPVAISMPTTISFSLTDGIPIVFNTFQHNTACGRHTVGATDASLSHEMYEYQCSTTPIGSNMIITVTALKKPKVSGALKPVQAAKFKIGYDRGVNNRGKGWKVMWPNGKGFYDPGSSVPLVVQTA